MEQIIVWCFDPAIYCFLFNICNSPLYESKKLNKVNAKWLFLIKRNFLVLKKLYCRLIPLERLCNFDGTRFYCTFDSYSRHLVFSFLHKDWDRSWYSPEFLHYKRFNLSPSLLQTLRRKAQRQAFSGHADDSSFDCYYRSILENIVEGCKRIWLKRGLPYIILGSNSIYWPHVLPYPFHFLFRQYCVAHN